MAIIAKRGEQKQFFMVPAGTIQAVCFDIWNIGFQETPYKDKNGNTIVQHKVIIAFETTEPIPQGEFAGKRMTINKFYTLSLSEKANLLKDLEGWRGKAFTETELDSFDIEKLIGLNCMLNVVHTEKGKAKIGGISKLMNGLMPLKPENARSLPDWVKVFQEKQVPNPYEEVEEVSTENGEGIPF